MGGATSDLLNLSDIGITDVTKRVSKCNYIIQFEKNLEIEVIKDKEGKIIFKI